jgi:Na+/H+-dicarboxylate symporter
MTSNLTRYILIALVLGVLTGWAINTQVDPAQAKAAAGYLGIVTDIFLRLIKMIIAPLVLATLVTGIAHMGQGASIGRMFGRTLAWFIVASLVSLSLGLIMVNLLEPGVGVNLPLPAANAATGLASGGFDLKIFVSHIVPKSIFEAMSTNEVLQIVVFSMFAGIGLTAIGEAGKPITRGLDALVHLMLKITGYVMNVAPFAVFAAVAASIAVEGLAIIGTFARFMGGFYLALAILWLLLIGAGSAVIGFAPVVRLLKAIREPFLLTFATASSEASYPKLLLALERFGISPRIASFVLPLGYSFNLDGSMMYCAFASVFIAQAYGIELSTAQMIGMLLLLMITSKGIAGVPRASLVVITATLPFFDIPEEGVLLILAIDHFLDMGRSATNVIGNAIATAVVSKWEGDHVRGGDLEPASALKSHP